MKTLQFDFDVAAPPDRVFAALTKPQRLKEWRTLDSAEAQVVSRSGSGEPPR